MAAEDTRRVRALAARLGVQISGRVLAVHEHNEAAQVPLLLEAVREGAQVLMVSDAGMPSVSDPGYRLVVAAVQAGLPVTVAPGPSAVLTALALSGLATDRFCFEGFLSRRAGERRRALADLVEEPRTMVLFEAPHRLVDLLQDVADVMGADRQVAVCRELTKTHEEVRRGPISEVLLWAQDGPVRGEIAVVIAGRVRAVGEITSDLVAQVRARVDLGERLKTVVAEMADGVRVSRQELYAAVVAAKRGVSGDLG